MRQNQWLTRTRIITLALLVLTAGSAFAIQRDRTRRLRFPRGMNSTTVEDAVVRGTRDRYIVGARQGQTMTVRIRSLEDNAVFDVYMPRSRRPASTERTEWSGTLPRTGDYVIEVGGTRGNATYALEVTID